jgi:hypothetical protein
VPDQPFRDERADRRRTTLFLFYLAALLSVTSISLVAKIPSSPTLLFAVAVTSAGAAMFFLLRFLRTNDEREQQTNYSALTFAFTGTLIFSAAVGFLQTFGLHPVS